MKGPFSSTHETPQDAAHWIEDWKLIPSEWEVVRVEVTPV